MSKPNNKTLTATLLREGKIIEKRVQRDILILIVEAFGHTYRIENPYSKYCKITQEN